MASKYNVIILVFDTLRSDYLSCYESDANTPAFESAAHQGITFESAFGVAPGTSISHASIYTGQYPSEHGVTGQYIRLPGNVPVIAEYFRDAGYDTLGITGPSKMGSDWGYGRGFNEFFEPYYEHPEPTSLKNIYKSITDQTYGRYFVRQLTKGGREKTRYKFELLKNRITAKLDQPFLALCNFLTVHGPYDPPRPYKEQATPEFSRPSWFLLEYLMDNRGAIKDPDIRVERVTNLGADKIGRYLADPTYFNQKEIQLLRDWYRASVTYLDDELQRFLKFYQKELQNDTILLLTADHGEQLGEHQLWEHSHYFYDETLKIPLIVIGPELPSGVNHKPLVSHVDIFDMLCELCDVDPPDTTSGVSPFSENERDAVFMEYGRRDITDFSEKSGHGRYLDPHQLREFSAGRKAIRTEHYRFELDSRGTERLFELPEQVRVAEPPSGITSRLRESLLETLGEDFGFWPEGDPDDTQLGDKVKRNLQKLGYIE